MEVGEPVGVVGVLVSVIEADGIVAGQFAGAANGAVGTLVGVSPLDASAIGVEDSLALRGDVGGHGELDGKAEGRAEHGEGDASVAAAGVEEDLAGREQTAGAGVAHDGGGGAVFDASAGVGPLGFGQKRNALEAMHRPLKTDQRRGADTIRDREAELLGGWHLDENCSVRSGYARLGMRG